MECIFCPASQMESLGEACAVHGIDGDEICAALNEKLEEYKD
jgi:hydroxylamine reductase